MVAEPMMNKLESTSVNTNGCESVTHELRLATWNVRGLRQSQRRREIFASLERLSYDIVVLQETRFRACSGDEAAARRDWSQGRTLWSCSPDGLGGVGVLLRWESEVQVDSWADLWPGHLLYVDFTLRPGRGGGGSGPPPPQREDQPCTRCRLLAVYAPVREAERRPLWARLRDFLGNTARTVLVAGDFNNRARPEDRTGRLPRGHPETGEDGSFGPQVAGVPPQVTTPPALTDEEGQLRRCLESKSLEDAGLAVPNAILFHPTHSVETYKANHAREFATRGFTYYHPQGASRIDRVYAQGRKWRTERCNVVLTTWSDHGLLCVRMRSLPPPSLPSPVACPSGDGEQASSASSSGGLRRRGGWRLRNELLRQQEYYERLEYLIVVQWIREGDSSRRRAEEPARWWEELKVAVGRLCRCLAGRYYRRELRDYHRALGGFLRAHAHVNRGLPVDGEALRRCESDMQAFLTKQREGRRRAERARTRGPILGQGDWRKARLGTARPRHLDGLRRPPTTSSSSSSSPGTTATNNQDQLERGAEGMIAIIGDHYRRLFAGSEVPEERIRSYLEGIQPRLVPSVESGLTAPVTPQEVARAIGQGREASAPGPDGLGYGFYKAYVRPLSAVLAEVFTEYLEGRTEFSGDFFGGFLHLIYKDVGDPTRLENWRPINISNVDYRLLTRVLSNRLASRADELLVAAQSSAVPGRRMTHSLRVVREVFDAVTAGEWGGALVAMDQSKAFDRVHRPYLWRVLERKGVPLRFIDWLQRVYRSAHVRPTVEGLLGPPIWQLQGLRQGCPLSPLLYVLALDPFLERVQADASMRGVPLGLTTGTREHQGSVGKADHERVVLLAHADDATFFVSDVGGGSLEMERLRMHMREYAEVSGAAVNHDKSAVYLLPRGGSDVDMLTTTLQRVGASTREAQERDGQRVHGTARHVRVLGVWFGTHPRSWRYNWELWKNKALFQLDRWKPWRLDVYQRAAYVNGYILPHASFLAETYPPPADLTREVHRAVRHFVLGTNNFPVHPAEVHRSIPEGGLGLKNLAPWLVAGYASTNLSTWWHWIGRSTVGEGAQGRVVSNTGETSGKTGVEERGGGGEGGTGDPQQGHSATSVSSSSYTENSIGTSSSPEPNPVQYVRRTRATWASYGNRWAHSDWARKWWWQAQRGLPELNFSLTARVLAGMPDHLVEFARAAKHAGISAESCMQDTSSSSSSSNTISSGEPDPGPPLGSSEPRTPTPGTAAVAGQRSGLVTPGLQPPVPLWRRRGRPPARSPSRGDRAGMEVESAELGGGSAQRGEEEEARRLERRVRADLYARTLERLSEQAEAAWQRRGELGKAPAYRLRGEDAAREAFGGSVNRIPLSLWETRWRAYHGVLQTGDSQPWLPPAARTCMHCKYASTSQLPTNANRASSPPRETAAHFVGECPAARRLWHAVSQRLGWPALARQHWETVVSGLRPRRGDGNIDASILAPRTGRATVPWSVVRLVNLATIGALGLQRAREAEDRRRAAAPVRGGAGVAAKGGPGKRRGTKHVQNPVGPEPWAEVVLKRLTDSAQWERRLRRGKGVLGLEAWQAKWGWLFSTPIT